jgi:5,10-methylenetetrahydrofolate reductase
MVKIADAIRSRDEPFISVEFFPPRTEDGLKNLKDRMLRMQVRLSSSRPHARRFEN